MNTSNLNAKDLMVGDWVSLSKGNWSENRKVELIDIEMIAESVYLAEPIPITPDVLEKNGFEKTQIHGEKQDDIFQCFDGEIIIEVGIYDPNFILIHYRYETPDGINSGELSSIVKVDGGKFYLHELQHALRLCGISKQIEL